MDSINLGGDDWELKEFVGMDWVWRDSVMPDTQDARWWIKAGVPGTVLNDLWRAGRTPDPYYECNSRLVEWVPERTWVYRKSFVIPKSAAGKKLTLCLKGIDYEGEIFLNGESLGNHKGMFIPWEREVTERVHTDRENLLAVVIEPAPKEQPQVGKTSLVTTHKSRMTYWWDFCPRMIHQGIWDDVYLKVTGEAVLTDVHLVQELDDGLQSAIVSVHIEAANGEGCMAEAEIDGEKKCVAVKNGGACLEFLIEKPKLWWPNGYGEACQYPIRVTLYNNKGVESDRYEKKLGIRKVLFLPNENTDPAAPHFLLCVNGKAMYMNGYNWVPADVMYGPERPGKMSRLLRLAAEAGANIFRIWGGGLIEKDAFYDQCAEHGILIWQEFILSSSGIDNKTPTDAAYLEMLREQAEVIIKKKRNHTSLAVWCGGNELQDDQGMPLDGRDPVLKMLGEQVETFDSGRKWLPTSPSGGVFLNSEENLEKNPDRMFDVHGPWEHQGLKKHNHLYNNGTSLLHSEFGTEGMANRGAMPRFMAGNHVLPAGKDNEIYFHRGAWWNNEPLIQETFGGKLDNIDSIRKASQYMQYEGLKYAVECNRRRSFHNSGSFPWQFNEPYPNLFCTSHVDYYGNPKPVYYGMKKAYAPWTVTACFQSSSLSGVASFECEMYVGANGAGDQKERNRMCVETYIYSMTGECWFSSSENCRPEAGRSVSAGEIKLQMNQLPEDLFLLRLRLTGDGMELAENEYLFTRTEDFKYLHQTQEPELESERIRTADGKEKLWLRNTGKIAALFVSVTPSENQPDEVWFYFEDNYFTLLPGETREIGFEMECGQEQNDLSGCLALEALNVSYKKIG